MFDIASLLSGLVKAFNFITQWMKERELVQTGKTLRKGEEDDATLKAVQKATTAGSNPDNDKLDDELCIDK